MNQKLSLEKFSIFLYSLFIILYIYAFILTVFSIFYKPLILFGIFGFLISLLLVLLRFKIEIPKHDVIAIILISIFTILNLFFMHETFLSISDEGVYSNSAIYLIRSHSLKIQEDIDYPGFIKIKEYHIPQFHFGYISFLGIFAALFGPFGILNANILPFFFTLLFLYFLCKKLTNHTIALWFIPIFATFYPIIWVTRRTLSEMFTSSLIWFSIFSLEEFHKTKERLLLYASLLGISFLPFVRPEGIFIFISYFVILLVSELIEKQKFIDKFSALIFIITILIFLIYSFYIQPNYFETLKEIILEKITKNGKLAKLEEGLGFLPYDAIGRHLKSFTIWTLTQYNFGVFIVFGILGLLWLFTLEKSRRWHISVIFFTILTSFIYFYNPAIYPTQPWILRRFTFSIIPFFTLTSLVFLDHLCHHKRHYFKYLILFLLLLINIIISRPILFFSEYNGMLNTLIQIGKYLPNNSLILFRNYSLKDYDPTTFIFSYFNKKIKMIKTLDELENIVKKNKNRSIYVLISDRYNDEIANFYSQNIYLEKVNKFNVSYNSLESTGVIPGYKYPGVSWWNQLSYHYVKAISNVPSKITKEDFSLYLYKILIK